MAAMGWRQTVDFLVSRKSRDFAYPNYFGRLFRAVGFAATGCCLMGLARNFADFDSNFSGSAIAARKTDLAIVEIDFAGIVIAAVVAGAFAPEVSSAGR